MNSRLSEEYNIRAARLTMLPGGISGLPVNVTEGGEPNYRVLPVEKIRKMQTDMDFVPTNNDLVRLSEATINRYENKPLNTATTFTGVLGAHAMNQQYTKVKKRDLPDRAFDIIGSEKYPDPPIVWQTWIGADSRFFGRSGVTRYNR